MWSRLVHGRVRKVREARAVSEYQTTRWEPPRSARLLALLEGSSPKMLGKSTADLAAWSAERGRQPPTVGAINPHIEVWYWDIERIRINKYI